MNCKPGDLAVTTGMLEPKNNDVIVEVESLDSTNQYGAIWNVKHRTPMFVDWGPGAGRWVTNGQIHDCNLRPISGVPMRDEQLEEITV